MTSINHFKVAKRQLEEAAHEFLQKDKRINIRISSRDLNSLLDMRKVETNLPDKADAHLTTNGIIHMDQKRVSV